MKSYYLKPIVFTGFLLFQFPHSWATDESTLPVIPDAEEFDPAQVDSVPSGLKTRGSGDNAATKRLPPAPRTEKDIIRLMKKPANVKASNGRLPSPKARAYINFDSGSDQIKAASRGLLSEWAKALQNGELSNAVVKIVGHTDSDGPEDFNIELSEQRAISVKNYLIDQGVDESRFRIDARGESQPYVSNTTVAGKAVNRRVEFVLTYSSSNEGSSSDESQSYYEEDDS